SKAASKTAQHDLIGNKEKQKPDSSKVTSNPKSEQASGKKSYTEGEVDWDAPYNKNNDSPMNWPSGWGKFPGSKYLGMDDNKNKPAKEQSSK
ncbi:MAG: hypothetical protein JRE63_05120, partial [Deltaproteobacteria bacterium]|nr:hypothetical protein [Deltaproteobacteria bacterium]